MDTLRIEVNAIQIMQLDQAETLKLIRRYGGTMRAMIEVQRIHERNLVRIFGKANCN